MRAAAAVAALALGAAAVLLATAAPARATLGISFSDPVTEDQMACVKASGFDFGVVRAWHSYGAFDDNAVAALRTMHRGGLSPADVQMNPCPTADAADQMNEMIARLQEADADYGVVWINVEAAGTGCQWPIDHTHNCKYLGALVSAGQNNYREVGVIASDFVWGSVVGESCAVAGPDNLDAYVTYQHFNRQPNYDDWRTFGGWTEPDAKQYLATQLQCGDGLSVMANFVNSTAHAVMRERVAARAEVRRQLRIMTAGEQ